MKEVFFINTVYDRQITLKNKKITYHLQFKNVKYINVRISVGKGLCVSAPFGTDIAVVEAYLRQLQDKIAARLNTPQEVPPAGSTSNRQNSKIKSPSKQNRHINLNGQQIEYELEFKKIKRINLSIKLNRGIHISAPVGTKISVIESFMKQNADFITKTIEKHKQISRQLPKPKQFINGEYFYFLGEKKIIQVQKGSKNSVVINDDKMIIITVDPSSFEQKQTAVDKFLKQKCNDYVTALCRELYPRFRSKNIPYPKEIRFRKMISCWGNCRPKLGVLTFSTYLIQLPPQCIEAVVCHEFTHFLHANHSKEFYIQLTEFMPEYKTYDSIMRDLQNEIIIKE